MMRLSIISFKTQTEKLFFGFLSQKCLNLKCQRACFSLIVGSRIVRVYGNPVNGSASVSLKPETKMWKQGMRKTFEPRNQLVCPLPQSLLLVWEDKPELLLLLLLSPYLGQVMSAISWFESSVQWRYWPDLRLTALLCFPGGISINRRKS